MVDLDELKKFSFKVWNYKMGEQVSLLIHLGDRLGIYKAMAGAGPMTSEQVADAAGLEERFVREWLMGQAAAGLVDLDDGSFELSPVGAAVLADEDGSLTFSCGAFRGGVEPQVIDLVAESFRTGIGITYEQQGPDAAAGLARMTAPWTRHSLTSMVLPALDGVVPKLEAGATVCDIGCGGGITTTTLARDFPESVFVGVDPSVTALGLARDRAAEMGLDNVEFVEATGEQIEAGANYDLVLTFDCMHDMAFPDRTARAIRAGIADDGTWLLKDIRSTGDFATDSRNPLLAMFYGFSIMSCLQSACSEPGGAGLGTLGLHPQAAQDLTEAAGFSRFKTHDFPDPANLYYEVKV